MHLVPTLATASALTAALLAAPSAATAAAPAPGIAAVTLNGTGCRPGTATAAFSLDRTAVTITYSDYLVSANGSPKPVSKTCRINLTINPVPGYAPEITSVDYRGFADLAQGSVARLTATYGFHGALHIRSATMRLAGPYSDLWQATDADEEGLVKGWCRGSNVLDLDSTLSLDSTRAGAATDLVTMDSTDATVPATAPAKVVNTFHLRWGRCL